MVRNKSVRVGWLASSRYIQRKWTLLQPLGIYRWFSFLPPATRMRVGNVAEWINRNTPNIRSELFDPRNRYDVAIIVKGTSQDFQDTVSSVKEYGGKVIYDVNVNYWEIWGDYDSSSPKPNLPQHTGAISLAKVADLVVTDSSYLAGVAGKYNHAVHWIPDNVNLSIYSKLRRHEKRSKLRLVWSGMSHKAEHLTLIYSVLEELADLVELVLVSEKKPSVMDKLPKKLTTHYVKFSDRNYAATLPECDVIISPKRLRNAYDMGHTEYKITLGMSAGLPAVASPQQSYVEAISYRNGGFIANSLEDWFGALQSLHSNIALRSQMGKRAHLTVVEKYSTSVIASMYADVIYRVVAL